MDVEQRARGALASHPYGFLVTLDADGNPSVRLVQHLVDDDAFVIWVGTSPRSRKVAEVRRTGHASYAVEDRAAFASFVLSGPATIVEDEAARVAHWADGFEVFFPDGSLGDDYVLVRLEPNAMEVVDFAHGIHPDPYGLTAQCFRRADDDWEPDGTSRDRPSRGDGSDDRGRSGPDQPPLA